MNANQLTEFLVLWSDKAVEKLKEAGVHIYAEPNQYGYFQNTPASLSELEQLENRIGNVLPCNIKNFYTVSNGLRFLNVEGCSEDRLFGVEEIDVLSKKYPETLENWLEWGSTAVPDKKYFIYGEKQSALDTRLNYLNSAIALSRNSSSQILANVEIVSESGEWEIWDLRTYAYGAKRYRDFDEFLNEERIRYFRGLDDYLNAKKLNSAKRGQ